MKSRYAGFLSQKICVLYLKIQISCYCLPMYLSIYSYARNFWSYRNKICFYLWTSKLKKKGRSNSDTKIENTLLWILQFKKSNIWPTSNISCLVGTRAYISYFFKFAHCACNNRIMFNTILYYFNIKELSILKII